MAQHRSGLRPAPPGATPRHHAARASREPPFVPPLYRSRRADRWTRERRQGQTGRVEHHWRRNDERGSLENKSVPFCPLTSKFRASGPACWRSGSTGADGYACGRSISDSGCLLINPHLPSFFSEPRAPMAIRWLLVCSSSQPITAANVERFRHWKALSFSI